MKKFIVLFYVNVIAAGMAFAQGTAINSTGAPADSSAGLDVDFSNKGFLMPRLTTSQRNSIPSPATGLMIFNSTTNCFEAFVNGAWNIVSCPAVCNPPSAAGTISGQSYICPNQTGVGYSVAAINNATGYNWTLPAGASIASGANTNSITADFSSNPSPGDITVYGTNSCGDGTVSPAFAITVGTLPDAVGSVSGTASVCQGQNNVSYSVSPITGATTYSWNYSGTGATITGNTNSVTVDFSASATSGNLTVYGVNSCGNGTVSPAFAVTVGTLPDAAGSVSGTASVCQGQSNVSYSVSAISGATSYSWNYSGTGATITGNTNSVTVSFSASATSGNLTVYGVNSCGNGTVSPNYYITVNTASHSSQNFTCTGSSTTFVVPSCVYSVTAKIWGAGGGGNNYGATTYGGAGGYTTGTIAVTPGETLTVVVGCGGTQTMSLAYMGGGQGISSGGGLSGIFSGTPNPSSPTSTAILIAGGGGGAGNTNSSGTQQGGAGGGVNGLNGAGSGSPPPGCGGGGTQSAGGSGWPAGTGLQGGSGQTGGGGGLYGGGAGTIGCSGWCAGGAGGGSGYVASSGVSGGSTTAGSGYTPPNTGDPDYPTGINPGWGSYAPSGGPGKPGYIHLSW